MGRTEASEPASRPLIVAHRGLLRHAPENTLANFRACLELGFGFEFDVEITQDGHLVCIHDRTVDRTTNGQGEVSKLTLQQVRQLDAGSWFDPRFAGQKVPTVEEVLQLVAAHREAEVLIAVDLKAAKVGAEVVRMAEELNILHRLLFIGRTISEPAVRDRIKAASANARTAAVANHPAEFQAALETTNADWVYVRYLPSRTEMDAVHAAGKQAFIAGATVSGNVSENWQHASVAGVDAILTDYPLPLAAQLREERN